MGDTINVAFTTDKNFFSQLAVAILSIKENMQMGDVHIYVLTDEENKNSLFVKRIEKLQQKNLNITFLYINKEVFGNDVFVEVPGSRLTIASIYRLLLGELLPTEVEKILYLDTDMLICSDLHELYMEDVKDVIGGQWLKGQRRISFLFKRV